MISKLLLSVAVILAACSVAHAALLTFDEFPLGTILDDGGLAFRSPRISRLPTIRAPLGDFHTLETTF